MSSLIYSGFPYNLGVHMPETQRTHFENPTNLNLYVLGAGEQAIYLTHYHFIKLGAGQVDLLEELKC